MTTSKAFELAVAVVLKHEGGYVSHPADKGGETKYGISKRAYPNLNIKNLTEADAKAIYYRDYWEKYSCDEMQPMIAVQVFDLFVNTSPIRAGELIQVAVNAHVGTPSLVIDGKLGPVSVEAINKAAPDQLIKSIKAVRGGYYLGLIAGMPTQTAFKTGWLKRVGLA
jgi:lysozyme family protein